MTEILIAFLAGAAVAIGAMIHVIRRYQHRPGRYGDIVRWVLGP